MFENLLKAALFFIISFCSFSLLSISLSDIYFKEESFLIIEYTPYFKSALGYAIDGISTEKWDELAYYIVRNDLLFTFSLQMTLSFLFPSLISLYLSYSWFKSSLKKKPLNYIDGPKLRFEKEASDHALSMHKEELKNRKAKDGIYIHPKIKISNHREENNFLIFGTTGSGKSTMLKPMIKQVIDRGDTAILYDEKAEYTSMFYDDESTVLLAPWDSRSHIWDISKDIKTPEDAQLFAKCLLPTPQNDKDRLWIEGAQIIFTAMIEQLRQDYVDHGKKWGWSELSKQLCMDTDDMASLIKAYAPHATYLIQDQSKTTQGFLVHIASELDWIKTMAKAWPDFSKRTFSINEWLPETKSPKTKIIIQSHSRFEAVGAPLCSAFIAFMTSAYLAGGDSGRRTWLFIDEFANLPKSPSIKKWLELSRSKGASSVLCTQSPSQLKSIYGEEDANTLMSLLSNIITLRISSAGSDAAEVSRMFGEQEVEVPNYDHKERIGHRQKQPVITATDLSELQPKTEKGVTGFLLIPGWRSVYKITWPYFNSPKCAPPFVEAEWVQEKPQPKAENLNRLNRRGP